MKQVVREKEEKIETLNKSFDERDKLLQDLESRYVALRLDMGLHLYCFGIALWIADLDCIPIVYQNASDLYLDCLN